MAPMTPMARSGAGPLAESTSLAAGLASDCARAPEAKDASTSRHTSPATLHPGNTSRLFMAVPLAGASGRPPLRRRPATRDAGKHEADAAGNRGDADGARRQIEELGPSDAFGRGAALRLGAGSQRQRQHR